MKVSVNKLENVVGDMQLIEEKMTEFCTLNGKWRSTKERVYLIEIKMEMSDGTSYVSSVNTSKFTYKPAGPATGRFPIDDISELDQALRSLIELQGSSLRNTPGSTTLATLPVAD